MSGVRLAGRHALVTGGSSGIGRAIAVAFAEEGAAVAVAGRDARRCGETHDLIRGLGGRAHVVLGDVSRPESAEELVNSAAEELGQLDIVVSSAGVAELEGEARVHETSVEAWDETIAVNLRGPFLVARYALPHLIGREGGAFLHISSACAVSVWEGDCAYAASKSGLNMLSRHIAVEYAGQGIRSNTLMPGAVETPMLHRGLHRTAERHGRDVEAETGKLAGEHPLGRVGTAEEVASAAVFLCSEEASFITGSEIPVDGGYVAR